MSHSSVRLLSLTVLVLFTLSCRQEPADRQTAAVSVSNNLQTFLAKGIVKQFSPDGHTVVVNHEEIPNYMAAMTMPFRARDTNELTTLRVGDEVTFRLSVTSDESWIDHVRKTGRNLGADFRATDNAPTNTTSGSVNVLEALSTYPFTNEFGRAVRLSDYQGQAIGFTFFFTRCPLPDYCPRLTKNFVGATAKLKTMSSAPTNWHLFSISFDPEFDTPAVLRGYGRMYGYDSNRWSFLTASVEDMREITSRFGFSVQKSPAGFDHNFLTMVLDAQGYVRSAWPIGGDTTDNLVAEIVKAAAMTNANRRLP
jgi:protein SCO1/2